MFKCKAIRREHLVLGHLVSHMNPHEHNNNKKTPLDLAHSLNDTELINLLRFYKKIENGKRGRKRGKRVL